MKKNYLWKSDFSQWIHKKFNCVGILSMETENCSDGSIAMRIDDKDYELVNLAEPMDYYGNEEETSIFCLQEGCFEYYEEYDVEETIEKIFLVLENQQLNIKGKKEYETDLVRALIIRTNEQDYCFEKDFVSFSEIIRFYMGKDLCSQYPKKNSWFEEEYFYGEEDIETKCTQTIKEIGPKEYVFKIEKSQMKEVNKFMNKHSHCDFQNFLFTFGRNQLSVECTCGDCLKILSS